MKKTFLTFVILFCASTLFAQNVKSSGYSSGSNPHDSLLFDGAPEVFMNKGGEKNCKWKVKHVWGNVRGTKDTVIQITHSCGVPIDYLKKEGVKTYLTQIRTWLKDGDEVYDNDSLIMDGSSFIQIEMNHTEVREPTEAEKSLDEILVDAKGGFRREESKTLIVTAKCNNFKVPSCSRGPMISLGDLLIKRQPVPGAKYLFEAYGSQYTIKTDQCIIKNNGTKYSVEQTETDDIIRVYEGSVEVQPTKFYNPATMEMGKLQEDYQNGKISLEELTNKAKELAAQIKEESIDVSKKNIVEAGYQVTVSGKVGDIISIQADDDRWWDKWDK